MEILLAFAQHTGHKVVFKDFKSKSDGLIKGKTIALSNKLKTNQDKMAHVLAHELAHSYLHYDKGNIIGNDGEYERQADRVAKLLIDAIAFWVSRMEVIAWV